MNKGKCVGIITAILIGVIVVLVLFFSIQYEKQSSLPGLNPINASDPSFYVVYKNGTTNYYAQSDIEITVEMGEDYTYVPSEWREFNDHLLAIETTLDNPSEYKFYPAGLNQTIEAPKDLTFYKIEYSMNEDMNETVTLTCEENTIPIPIIEKGAEIFNYGVIIGFTDKEPHEITITANGKTTTETLCTLQQ